MKECYNPAICHVNCWNFRSLIPGLGILLVLSGCISSVNLTSNRNQVDDCEFVAQVHGYGDQDDDNDPESTVDNILKATSARRALKIQARRLDANFVLITETSSTSIKGEAYDCP